MKRWFYLGIPLILLLALIGWKVVDKKKADQKLAAAQKAKSSAPANVRTATAGPRDILQVVQTVGSVQSPYDVKLSPKTAGPITFLQVREGDLVKAGQVLVKIDPSEARGEVLQNEANVAEAQQRLAQAQITQAPTVVGVNTNIYQQKAAVASSAADLNQVNAAYDLNIAVAKATVTDSQAKVSAAQSAVTNAKAQVESAQATFKDATTKYNRTESLFKQNFIAAQDVDDAKAAVDVAKAAVDVANGQLQSAQQAVTSAQAVLASSEANLRVVAEKGKSDIQDSRAKLTQNRQSLKLAASNRAQAPAYQANLDALRSAVTVARGQLGQAQSHLSDTDLVSPIDGTVTARALDPGGIATPGTPVVTVEYNKWVYVNASIPVEQSDQIYAGQNASITFDALTGQTFEGKINQVNASADPTSRQFNILIRLDNPKGILRTGMFGRVTIVTKKVPAPVTVPLEAVTTNADGTTTVTIVDKDSVAHVTPVKLGMQDSQGYQVLSGVNAGDQVVVLAYSAVQDGKEVKTQDSKGGKSAVSGGAKS